MAIYNNDTDPNVDDWNKQELLNKTAQQDIITEVVFL